MNYHNITTDDMLNGSGLRTVLWVSGCDHHCEGCHNPETWDPNSGIEFDDNAMNELLDKLSKDYISGLTISGGDPLHKDNVSIVAQIIHEVKDKFPDKNIWVYTGFTIKQILEKYEDYICGLSSAEKEEIMSAFRKIDVLVDGRFDITKTDKPKEWVGSYNQNVIYNPFKLSIENATNDNLNTK